MHLVLTGGFGDVEQRSKQSGANAAQAKRRQDHQRKLGLAVRGHVFAMSQDFAIVADCQHGDAIALIQRIDAAQQRQVGRLAVSEVALVKTVAIHCTEKAPDTVAVLGARLAYHRLAQVGRPLQAGIHDCSPARKSATASITAGSLRMRR